MSIDDLVKIIEVLKWPTALLLLGGFGLALLRYPLANMLGRLRRAAAGKNTIEFDAAPQIESQRSGGAVDAPLPPINSSANPPALPPPADAAIANDEETIRQTIRNLNASEEVRQEWLIRALAEAQVIAGHEVRYRLIMGSQLGLLLRANAGVGVEIGAAQEIYDQAVAAFPAIYARFSFDNWIGWPASVGLIRSETTGGRALLKITDHGKSFLRYLVNVGLTDGKPG